MIHHHLYQHHHHLSSSKSCFVVFNLTKRRISKDVLTFSLGFAVGRLNRALAIRCTEDKLASPRPPLVPPLRLHASPRTIWAAPVTGSRSNTTLLIISVSLQSSSSSSSSSLTIIRLCFFGRRVSSSWIGRGCNSFSSCCCCCCLGSCRLFDDRAVRAGRLVTGSSDSLSSVSRVGAGRRVAGSLLSSVSCDIINS
jgi:hypothetical protein